MCIHTALQIMPSIVAALVALFAIAAPSKPSFSVFVKSQKMSGHTVRTVRLMTVTGFMMFCTKH